MNRDSLRHRCQTILSAGGNEADAFELASECIRLMDKLEAAEAKEREYRDHSDWQRVAQHWLGVDWSKPNQRIANELGVTYERVRQVRAKLGKPKLENQSRVASRERRERLKQLDTSRMTLTEIADEIGVTKATASELLHELGRTATNGGWRTERKGPLPSRWKYDWDSVDWENEYNSEIARRFGCKPEQVTMFRKRHNKPEGPDGRRVTNRRQAQEAR